MLEAPLPGREFRVSEISVEDEGEMFMDMMAFAQENG